MVLEISRQHSVDDIQKKTLSAVYRAAIAFSYLVFLLLCEFTVARRLIRVGSWFDCCVYHLAHKLT